MNASAIGVIVKGDDMPRLGVVLVSVREGRAGETVAQWFLERAKDHGGFEVELVDLKAVDLPILREANHPRLQKYTEPKTQAWSKTVAGLDAFVFVTPEYNFSMPPSLVNALDHLYHEWSYKPAGFVSYGGVSGGLRSVQHAKSMMTTFKLVPMVEAVSIQYVAKALVDGRFPGGDYYDKQAVTMLDEMLRWTHALTPLRKS
jgi:NAD(P)H-dependent FMN reductase